MNKVNLRLANIAFKVFVAGLYKEDGTPWKMALVTWTQKEWNKYLSNNKTAPKFTPVVVPSKSTGAANNMIKKLMSQGKSLEETLDEVEKKYSKKTRKENEELWKQIVEKRKQERKLKRNQTKQTKRKNRAEEVIRLKEANSFVFRGEEFKKCKTKFSGNGAEIFDKIIKPVINENRKEDEEEDRIKKPLSKYDQDILKNQLLQYHKDRPKATIRVRDNSQLKQEFLSKMNPNAYANIDAFNEAKKRIQNMNSNEFMAMVHSIWDDDDEENVMVEPPKQPTTEDVDKTYENAEFK